jgi:hypothetical protein
MIKLLKRCALVSVLLTGTAYADEQSFFERTTEKSWSVFGGVNPDTAQATCYADTRWKDGSVLQIHRSLVDGEFWIFLKNTDWQIMDPLGPRPTKIRINFYNGKRVVEGGDMSYSLTAKNTLFIPNIETKRFVEALAKSNYINFIMPGTTSNIGVSIADSRAMITGLYDCIKSAGNKFKGMKPEGAVPDLSMEKDKL